MLKKKDKTLTTRQQKLIKLISDNFGNKENGETMYKMMLAAGFTKSTSKQQSLILAGVKEELQPIVQRLISHREKVMAQLEKKLPKAMYHQLIEAMDKLTKNIQLLSGGKTDNSKMEISWEK